MGKSEYQEWKDDMHNITTDIVSDMKFLSDLESLSLKRMNQRNREMGIVEEWQECPKECEIESIASGADLSERYIKHFQICDECLDKLKILSSKKRK